MPAAAPGTTDAPRRYRVVQWATGNIGRHSLRAVIDSPSLHLVGVWVSSEAKVGVDAGDLCGVDPVGVRATSDIEEILALRADCVLYMADRTDLDALCRILCAGTNVVTTRSELCGPAGMAPEVRARLDDACREGGTSIHSTGSSPGFVSEALPLVLTSLERRLDLLTIDEYADMSSRESPDMIFRLMGFGTDPTRFAGGGRAAHVAASFGPSLRSLGDALGLPIDDVVGSAEAAVATREVEVAAGRLRAGTVAAQRTEVTGLRHGEPLLRFRSNWYLTTDIEPAWDLGDTGWRVRVDGDVPLDVQIRFPVAPEDWAAISPGLTAHRPVNAVRAVCEAEPGIRSTADLPQVIAEFSTT